MITAESPIETANPASGSGHLRFRSKDGRTIITRAAATSPLRLLTPRNAGHGAWAFTSSFGGGLLGGDQLSLDIEVAPNATAYIGSQSSTKVYRCANGRTSEQRVSAQIQDRALLVLTPDPVVCFAGARYTQHQRFSVAPTGGLVLLDWFTSGRHACGERWAADAFRSVNQIHLGDRLILLDKLRLDAAHGFLAGSDRMGAFNCFATLVLVGERVAAFGKLILNEISREPIRPQSSLLFGASPLADGAIVRLAAKDVEQAAGFLYHHLGFLADLLGEHPWLRKA